MQGFLRLRLAKWLTRPLGREDYLLLALLLLAVATPLAASAFGAANIDWLQVASVYWHKLLGLPPPQDVPFVNQRILLELRLPRVMLAFICGAGLALSGWVLQTVTRNPLADPFLFGISSGASLGAIVALTVSSALFGSSLLWLTLPLGAFVGATLSVALVLALCGIGLQSQVERMLLAGVATSFLFGAMGSLLLYFSTPEATASVLFWTLGSFARANWTMLWQPLLVFSLFGLALFAGRRRVQALAAGDETAHALGVDVARLRLGSLLACSLMTATLVASCGGIGFVGLMVPHLVRQLFPGRTLLLLTALVGGLFMVWVDVLARCLLPMQELPVGIITAVIGSGFFLLLLSRRRQG
ncbi:FecCD family ABC transporter permease [Shewanella cyperi]|uniref:FecCD family ABC transporter permease n=1 Tax=Shewanella cyperi TaxID=2814292 RepID=UPI001A952FC7|nr:iron ABC transporter permease [Shewanella cyperi]QSX40069.1 iron ABC transporter permease [Shewanella cyperi]